MPYLRDPLLDRGVAVSRQVYAFAAGAPSSAVTASAAGVSGSAATPVISASRAAASGLNLSMIEPAGYGVPTLFGPNVWNFRDAANRLIEAGGAIKVADEGELFVKMQELLADPEGRREMGRKSQALVQAQQGATERTMDAIDQVL